MSISKTKKAKLRLTMPSNCWYCGCSDTSTVDHVTPKLMGGLDDLDNLVLCCKSCNSKKKAMSVGEFRFKMSWDKTKYSEVINHIKARELIKIGVVFDGFVNNHKFWFEGVL